MTTIAPIHVSGIRLGSLIIWRNDKEFADDDLILVEIASTVVGIQMLNFQREEDEKNIRRTAVNMAVNTLSYSELRAVSAILGELKGNEGQLTASVIADRIGITRSVIVNALRKLESAGIIESRSLGMKGTYLKVLIPDFFEEIKKKRLLMTKALISIDYTVDFVADEGKLTAGAPAQAISESIAQVTQLAFDQGAYVFFCY